MAKHDGVTVWETCALCNRQPAKIMMPYPERPDTDILAFCKEEHRQYWLKRYHARLVMEGREPGDQQEAFDFVMRPIPD